MIKGVATISYQKTKTKDSCLPESDEASFLN